MQAFVESRAQKSVLLWYSACCWGNLFQLCAALLLAWRRGNQKKPTNGGGIFESDRKSELFVRLDNNKGKQEENGGRTLNDFSASLRQDV